MLRRFPAAVGCSMPLRTTAALCAALSSAAALGATTVAQSPLGVPTLPKPNVMFVLDDSGSMSRDYMPDDLDNDQAYGRRSWHCNGVAFNPTEDYLPPVDAAGNAYPNASYTAAWRDGYNQAAGTDDLTGSSYYRYSGTETAMDWQYASNGQVVVNTFYTQCMTSTSDTSAVFTSTPVSAELQQKYANWYAYYRTRQLVMRTAAGRAMQGLDDGFRVGFTVISDRSVSSSQFLNVADFVGGTSTSQRTRFFDLLYGAPSAGNTPLRDTLSRVGRYFGKRFMGQTDPVQYSCQRNYALLSTDGYWNSDSSVVKLDGSAVGNEDGAESLEPKYRDYYGAAGTLADVAMYYYSTDLRSDTGMDGVQNLGLYTLGLGVKGTLSRSDWPALQDGTKKWPVPSGTTNTGSMGDATHIDDLWHAAVNGRGDYFFASSPTSLTNAIKSTFQSIAAAQATGSAAASSSQTPVAGDDWIFLPRYESVTWVGDVRAFRYEVLGDGTINTSTNLVWSASERLTAQGTARTIYFNNNGARALFNPAVLSTTALYGLFDVGCAGANPKLSQCSGSNAISATAKAQATRDNLISYLTGSRSLEMSATALDSRVFRSRASLLGDVVNAAPVYLGKPPFSYADAGYTAFVTAQSSRTKVVYVAANDGMLHAFKVDTQANGGGTELWAFVPTAAIANLWRLADGNYATNHRYFVDATPVVADVFHNGSWRSILIGGLGAGGRSYYALDVTNPTDPVLLWEIGTSADIPSTGWGKFIPEDNLGMTFGSPVVTKRSDGTWVVAFASGLNNTSPGDGKARLFVRNAYTGAPVTAIATDPADATAANDLMRIEGWVDSETDNTTLRFYGGDLQGNLWRFDHDNLIAPDGREAQLIGQAKDGSGNPQPITTRPLLSEIDLGTQKVALIAFGTGRYLSTTDLSDTSLQTIYAVRDKLDTTSLGNLRTSGNLVAQSTDLGSTATVDWSTQNGWYVDLTRAAGERIVIDGLPLSNGVLAFGSTIPSTNMCTAGGSSNLYQFSLKSGKLLQRDSFTEGLLSGLGSQMGSSGTDVTGTAMLSTGRVKQIPSPPGGSPETLPARRTSWRELTD